MRGCAISFSMRASVALLDSFLGSLTVPMSTPIVGRSASHFSPEHHDRSGKDACLSHIAQMSVQLRPTLVFRLDIGDKNYDDAARLHLVAVKCMLSVGREVHYGNSSSSVLGSAPFSQLIPSRPSSDTSALDKSGRDAKLV
jgi:hypothetical protein